MFEVRMLRICSFLFACSVLHSKGHKSKQIPTHPNSPYVHPGDINLGGIFAIGRLLGESSYCVLTKESLFDWQTAAAMVFAINGINNDDKLLPGIKLGFVMVDACQRNRIAANEVLKFHPALFGEQAPNVSTGFDVVGIVSGLNSGPTAFVSYIASTNHIPHVSFWATSDQLNSDGYSSYFLRTVPNDYFQSKAIVEFIARQGWSYFSILYQAGSYGESVFRSMRIHMKVYSMCFAVSVKLDPDMKVADYKRILRKLLHEPIRARVVVLVGSTDEMVKSFKAVYFLKAQNKLVWIGTDGWAQATGTLHQSFKNGTFGTFVTKFYTRGVQAFDTFLASLKPSSSPDPWFNRLWELAFECSLQDGTCNLAKSITDSPYFDSTFISAYAIDSVYVYAHALHKLLEDKCAGKIGTQAADCIKSRAQGAQRICNSKAGKEDCDEYDLMLPYLKSVSFNGYTGLVKFDSAGNRKGKFFLQQILPGNPLTYKTVRLIDTENSDGFEELNPISWDFVSTLKSAFGNGARPAKTNYNVADDKTPVSVCSRYCERKEIKIMHENSCCWTCRSCRENEKLVSNFQRCEKCPKFQWPDESTNFTTCVIIAPTHISMADPVALIINILSGIGTIASIGILIFYIKNRKTNIIKASSRELSFLQLPAIAIGFLAMTLQTLRPTKAVCVSSYILAPLSYNALYAAQLVKSIRIYRLVKASIEGKRRICAVKPLSQIIITVIIVCGQLLLCLLILIVTYIGPSKTQPVPTERYVEFFCKRDDLVALAFMGYNIITIVLCTIFAYKNRKLPGYFSESHFICLFAFTTLIIYITLTLVILLLKKEYTKTLVTTIGHEIILFTALSLLFVVRVVRSRMNLMMRLNGMFLKRSATGMQQRYSTPNKAD